MNLQASIGRFSPKILIAPWISSRFITFWVKSDILTIFKVFRRKSKPLHKPTGFYRKDLALKSSELIRFAANS